MQFLNRSNTSTIFTDIHIMTSSSMFCLVTTSLRQVDTRKQGWSPYDAYTTEIVFQISRDSLAIKVVVSIFSKFPSLLTCIIN